MPRSNNETKKDIELNFTNKIVEMLETAEKKNIAPLWHKSTANGMPLRANGQQYKGVNVLMLWLDMMVNGWSSNTYMTFKQANTLGAKVKKGSESTSVVFYKSLPITEKDANGVETTKTIPMLKSYNVFNLDQIEGLPEKFSVECKLEDYEPLVGRNELADKYIENTGAKITYGGNRACYIPSIDAIRVPQFEDFKTVEGFYSVALHELVHWTMTKERCDRNMEGSKRFGGKGYATEELVAELGACFGLARLGIATEPRQDHANYIANWLTALKNDKKFIFTASAKASQAIDYLDTLQENELKMVA